MLHQCMLHVAIVRAARLQHDWHSLSPLVALPKCHQITAPSLLCGHARGFRVRVPPQRAVLRTATFCFRLQHRTAGMRHATSPPVLGSVCLQSRLSALELGVEDEQ
jgi:hypothetical protein